MPIRPPLRAATLAALALPLAVLLLVPGCATVTRSECQSGDWMGIGERDGRAGEPPDLFARHAEGCARFGLPADQSAWEAGRQRGLQSYCTAPSGWSNGVAGRTYHGVCSGPAGGDFLSAYGLGSDVHRLREIAARADAEVDRVESALLSVADDIEETRRKLADATGEDRRRLRERLRDLEERRFDLRSDSFDVSRDARQTARDAEMMEMQARAAYFRQFGMSPPG